LPKAKIKRLYLIPILSKGLDVLELLEQVHGPISLEDVYKKTSISKTSVYRILKTLVHRGYVAQTQNGQYRLVARPRRLCFGLAVQSADLPFSQAVSRSVTAAAAAAGIELLLLDNRFDTETAVRNAEEFAEKRVEQFCNTGTQVTSRRTITDRNLKFCPTVSITKFNLTCIFNH